MTSAEEKLLDPCRLELGKKIEAALRQLAGENSELGISALEIGRLLEQPPEANMGDYALPCFRFAKPLKSKPQEIAQRLSDILSHSDGWLERTQVVGAFLNIFVSKELMAHTVLPAVLEGSWFERFLKHPVNSHQKVMIEYSQPNTHKEFHVGHTRNVCLGNSLVKLFRYCGYEALGANYFGDEGTHIATVLWYINKYKVTPPDTGRSQWLGQVYVMSKQALAEADPETRTAMNAEISEVHRQIESKTGDIYEQWITTRQWSLDDFMSLYDWLDVHFDELFYESEVSEESQSIVDEYLAKGVFKEDQGTVGVDLKPYKLGFSILRKSDGNTLYATKDLALARLKFNKFAIDRSIYVVADEQNHHFRQVFKVLELMGFEQAKKCHHLSYGMVVLPEGKMSSRTGTAVSFHQLRQTMLEELGVILSKYRGEWEDAEITSTAHRIADGAIKYGMLATDPVREIVFNLKDWLSFEGNSGPYLMYGYTRTQSILRKAAENNQSPNLDAVGELKEASEHELMRYLYDFNDVVAGACENYKPSQLASHLFYMCKAFNRFYSDVPVLKAESETLRGARLALTAAFSLTLKKGLELLGIKPPARM